MLESLQSQHRKWEQSLSVLTVISVFLNTLLFDALVSAVSHSTQASTNDLLTVLYTLLVFAGALMLWKKKSASCYILLIHWVWLLLQGMFECYHFLIKAEATFHPLFDTHYALFKEQIIITAIFKLLVGIPALFYLGRKMIDDLVAPQKHATTSTQWVNYL